MLALSVVNVAASVIVASYQKATALVVLCFDVVFTIIEAGIPSP